MSSFNQFCSTNIPLEGELVFNFSPLRPIKELNESDILEVIKIDKEFFPDPWSKKGWDDFLRGENRLIMILLKGHKEQIVGFSLYQASFLEGLAHLLKIIILPDFRKKRLGFEFLGQSFPILKELGLNRVFLEVGLDNVSAKGLYDKMGFEPLKITRSFYSNGCDALSMQKFI